MGAVGPAQPRGRADLPGRQDPARQPGQGGRGAPAGAYAAKARLVLAQQAVDGKSNEITAIPQVLDLLELDGAVAGIDAMGNQKAIAEKTAQGGADYVLALKDNHPQLREDAGLWPGTEAGKGALAVHETVGKDHGRIEIRRYVLGGNLGWLAQKAEWAGLQAVGRVESTRIVGGQASTEHRYYLTSLTGPGASPKWCVTIGPSRTASTGCWTCSSARTPTAPARATRRRTWAWCGAWP